MTFQMQFHSQRGIYLKITENQAIDSLAMYYEGKILDRINSFFPSRPGMASIHRRPNLKNHE